MNYRKLTPSMSLLLAFEASARHESFTRAAEELSLTQSAVSRHVQSLEAMLDLTLFQRDGKRIVPTDIGRAYFLEISHSLTLIRNATLRAVTSGPSKTRLRVATLPTFGSKWLMPRLHRFYSAYPTVQIDLASRIEAVDFSLLDLDAAIAVGDGQWAGVIAHRLYAEELVLVGSPSSLMTSPKSSNRYGHAPGRNACQRIPTIEELNGLTLLRVRSFPNAWHEWCGHFELPYDALRLGPTFELTSHLVQAVVAEIGVGLVPRMLVEEELREKRLLSPFDAVTSSRSYYLVYPERARDLPVLVAFRDWLLDELSRSC